MGGKLHRVGTFEFDIPSVEEHSDVLMKIMGTCVVLRCEMLYRKNALWYEAYSPFFDELKDGEEPPEYDVAYNGDTEEVTWTRKP